MKGVPHEICGAQSWDLGEEKNFGPWVVVGPKQTGAKVLCQRFCVKGAVLKAVHSVLASFQCQKLGAIFAFVVAR